MYALSVFRDALYVGGLFNNLGNGVTSANRIAAWNGSMWSTLASGSSNGLNGFVFALGVFRDTLYVGGSFSKLGDDVTAANKIAAWNGSEWSTLTSGGSNGVNSDVVALSVFRDKLYIGGYFNTLGDGVTTANKIAAWDGSVWSTLSSGLNNHVSALAVFGGSLYVGGGFQPPW